MLFIIYIEYEQIRKERESSYENSVESNKDTRFNTNAILRSINDSSSKPAARYEVRAATSMGYGRKIPTLLNRSVFDSKEITTDEKSRNTETQVS